MSKLSAKIKEEFLEILPPTIFFFAALHIVAFIRVLMLEGTGIAPATSATVTIAALVLGKAVVIADMLPFINRFPEKPLLHNVAWKTAIYLAVAALVHYLERLVDFWRRGGWPRRRQREAAGGDRLAAFLGHPDRPPGADPDVLHDARARTGDREGEDETDVLRAAADPAGLSSEFRRTARRGVQSAVTKASRNRYVDYVRTRIGGRKRRKA